MNIMEDLGLAPNIPDDMTADERSMVALYKGARMGAGVATTFALVIGTGWLLGSVFAASTAVLGVFATLFGSAPIWRRLTDQSVQILGKGYGHWLQYLKDKDTLMTREAVIRRGLFDGFREHPLVELTVSIVRSIAALPSVGGDFIRALREKRLNLRKIIFGPTTNKQVQKPVVATELPAPAGTPAATPIAPAVIAPAQAIAVPAPAAETPTKPALRPLPPAAHAPNP